MMALTKELINKALTDAQGFGIIKNRFTGSFESEVWYGLILDRMKLTTQATYPAYVEFNKQIHKFVIHISPVMAYELFKEMVPNETLKPLSDETQEDAEYKAFTAFLRGLIKHETMHVIFKHLINVGKQIDHSLANVCQDSLINLGIDEFKALGVKTVTAEEFYMVETGKMNVPGVAMIKGSRKLNNYTWEELYQMLLEDPNYKKTKEQEKVQQWFKQKVKERLDQQEQQSQKGDQPQDSDEQVKVVKASLLMNKPRKKTHKVKLLISKPNKMMHKALVSKTMKKNKNHKATAKLIHCLAIHQLFRTMVQKTKQQMRQ